MSKRFALDAWAILAFLQSEEPAATRVRELLSAAEHGRSPELFLSIVNLGEVYYIVGRVKGRQEADETISDLRRLPLTIVPASDDSVLAAAGFKMRHRISYADAFAAATAAAMDAMLVTGDPELLALKEVLSLEELIRA
jgi:uncharacterized protein